MASHGADIGPVFAAVASSTRRIFQLLKCISFVSKANVQINEKGMQVSVQDARVMQGNVMLGKELFSNYTFNYQSSESQSDNENEADGRDLPPFSISLDALLETLQIFGLSDGKDKWGAGNQSYGGVTDALARGGPAAAFDNRVLGMTGLCRLSYDEAGSPLRVILEETGVTTSCDLNTYDSDDFAIIPFQNESLVHKIIMRASWLLDAVEELSSTSPTKLMVVVSPSAPYFFLSAVGPLGSAKVEFNKDQQLLEIFQVRTRWANSYKFSYIKGASRAMALATKVSIRGDVQGVLNLQFMIEAEDGTLSFVDFRFVPYIEGEAEEDGDEGGEGQEAIEDDYEHGTTDEEE